MKAKAVLPTSSSSSEEEEATSSESDSSSDTSEAQPSKKPRTTLDTRSNDSKMKATVAAAAEEEEKEDTNKQQPFQRVFTEEDEIALLEGLFQYLKENRADDSHSGAISINMVVFHAYIKDSIHTEITKAQLSDKIKRLKKRFGNNQGRVFKQDSHDKHVFELCSKIWGVEESAGKCVPDPAINPSSPTLRKPMLSLFDTGFEDSNAMLDNFGSYVDRVIGDCESGSALKEKLMKLRVAHFELMIRHNLLRNETFQLIIEFIKSQAK